MRAAYCVVLAVLLIFSNITAKDNDDGLFLVHIITRHGERTPTNTFPKDEYKHETFYPVGHGRLTNAGKKRMYDVGLFLKNRYQNFLGNFYLPYQVEVMSSEYDRTQMTAQLLMAAIYPPKTAQIWNTNLTWQPIPVKYTSKEKDRIFVPESSCEKFIELGSKTEDDQKTQGKYKDFEPLFKTLEEHTGVKVTVPSQVLKIHDTLKCQKEWGLKLPSWTHDIYPEELQRVVDYYWSTYANTDELKRLGVGFMFKKIIDDTTKKINGTLPNKDMKLHVYSAHDSCIVPMLQLLDVFDGHAIPYGAYILVEIHKKGKDFTVKVFYQNNKQIQPRIMHLGNCSNPCGFNEFVNNYKEYVAEGNIC